MSDQQEYRQCAAVMVLRKSGANTQFLLLHKPRTNDAWQLPQGGLEAGETIMEAGLRELQEEAGIEVLPLGESSTTYQYDFPESFRSYRPDNVIGQHVSFIIAACTGQKITVDQQEIDDSIWVQIEQLPTYVTREVYSQKVEAIYAEGIVLYEEFLRVNA